MFDKFLDDGTDESKSWRVIETNMGGKPRLLHGVPFRSQNTPFPARMAMIEVTLCQGLGVRYPATEKQEYRSTFGSFSLCIMVSTTLRL